MQSTASGKATCGFVHKDRRIRRWVAILGCAFFLVPLKRDRPSLLAFPITALRLSPISRAICPHESPASIRFFRSAMRSAVHVV
jgi:hypothetical protein